jgi:hypothetical protein
MSLELKIEALTAAVVALTAKLEAGNVAVAAPVAQAAEPAPVMAPVVAAPVAAPAPAMPAPPTFVAPAPAPAPTGAPFSDGKGLIEYVMASYKALGPQKGAAIQTVLTNLAYTNISDVKPEHYAALYQGVEALKAA